MRVHVFDESVVDSEFHKYGHDILIRFPKDNQYPPIKGDVIEITRTPEPMLATRDEPNGPRIDMTMPERRCYDVIIVTRAPRADHFNYDHLLIRVYPKLK